MQITAEQCTRLSSSYRITVMTSRIEGAPLAHGCRIICKTFKLLPDQSYKFPYRRTPLHTTAERCARLLSSYQIHVRNSHTEGAPLADDCRTMCKTFKLLPDKCSDRWFSVFISWQCELKINAIDLTSEEYGAASQLILSY